MKKLGYTLISLFFTTSIFANCPDINMVKKEVRKDPKEGSGVTQVTLSDGNTYNFIGMGEQVLHAISFKGATITSALSDGKTTIQGKNTYIEEASNAQIMCRYSTNMGIDEFDLTRHSDHVSTPSSSSSWKVTTFKPTNPLPKNAPPFPGPVLEAQLIGDCTADTAAGCPFSE